MSMSLRFEVTIDCNNAAFTDGGGPEHEVAMILRHLADSLLEHAPDAGTLTDGNGNVVGSFAFLAEYPGNYS